MPILLGILLTLSVCAVAYGAGQLGDSVKTALETRKLVSIATQRANGGWGRAAPVWFMYDGEAVYFITAPDSYKARRIRRGSPGSGMAERHDRTGFCWSGARRDRCPHLRADQRGLQTQILVGVADLLGRTAGRSGRGRQDGGGEGDAPARRSVTLSQRHCTDSAAADRAQSRYQYRAPPPG